MDNEKDDIISDLLHREPTTSIVPAPKEESEYDYSLRKMKELLDSGVSAVYDAKAVAVETGSPESIKSLSLLIKSVGDIAKGVMDNAVSKSEIEKNQNSGNIQGSTNIQTKAVFIGTPSELLDKVYDDKEKVIEHER